MSDYTTYASLAILAVASIDDVRTRRVHNQLLAVLAFAAVAVILVLSGVGGLTNAFLGLLVGFIFYLPMAWFGVVGGGDLKLLAIVGILAGPSATLVIGLCALVWGAIMGLLQLVFKKEFVAFAQNISRLVKFQKVETQNLHRIPFAVALFLGALTQWTWGHL